MHQGIDVIKCKIWLNLSGKVLFIGRHISIEPFNEVMKMCSCGGISLLVISFVSIKGHIQLEKPALWDRPSFTGYDMRHFFSLKRRRWGPRMMFQSRYYAKSLAAIANIITSIVGQHIVKYCQHFWSFVWKYGWVGRFSMGRILSLINIQWSNLWTHSVSQIHNNV